MRKIIRYIQFSIIILISASSFGQKEDFTNKSSTFFIHIHKYFNKKVADSLSEEMYKTYEKLNKQINKDSLPEIARPPRYAHYDFNSVKYFRVNPKDYIQFEIRSKNDSVLTENNFTNILKISRDSLLTTIFRIDKFKTLDYKFKQRYKDFSNFKLSKVDKESKKKIGGFECYEVILESDKKILKMYVTDKIDLNYHPIINDLNILSEYYPLYIKIIDKLFPKDSFTEYRFIRGEI